MLVFSRASRVSTSASVLIGRRPMATNMLAFSRASRVSASATARTRGSQLHLCRAFQSLSLQTPHSPNLALK